MSVTKFISYGKVFQNLSLSIEYKVIGSEFTTFSTRVMKGNQVFFVCDSRVWGVANVASDVFVESERIWSDKAYPYRAKIDDIVIFKSAFTFSDYGIDKIFRDKIGKHWAFKVLFTPGDLPPEVVSKLNDVLPSLEKLEESEYSQYLLENQNLIMAKRRKKLGLKPL